MTSLAYLLHHLWDDGMILRLSSTYIPHLGSLASRLILWVREEGQILGEAYGWS
jgi:hypothetical protein